jgi:hypothetical protein
MRPRHAVLLTPSKSAVPRLPTATPLESTLVEVFILSNFKLSRMNTYEKHGGEGVSVFLTRSSALTLESLLVAGSHTLFVRSLRSFTKECLGTPLQPIRSALFFKTAGCVAICNQISELELLEDSRLFTLNEVKGPDLSRLPAAAGFPWNRGSRPIPLHRSGQSDRMPLNVVLTPHRETSPLFPVSKISRADTGCGNVVLPNPGQGSCHQAGRPGSRPG